MSDAPLLFLGLQADAWSAIGQVASAVIAAIGLPFIWYQLRQGRKANDLQNLHSFLNESAARDQAFAAAIQAKRRFVRQSKTKTTVASASPDDYDFELSEINTTAGDTFKIIANLAEIEATALRGRLYPPHSRRIVKAWVMDFCVTLAKLPEWNTWLEEQKYSEEDFRELTRFRNKHRKTIEAEAKRRPSAKNPHSAQQP